MENGVKLCWLESKLVEISDLLTSYRTLLDAHMVDFITLNKWETCVPQILGEERLRLTNEEWFDFLKHRQLEPTFFEHKHNQEDGVLSDYVNDCLKLSLAHLGACTDITTVLQRHGQDLPEFLDFDKFTSEKKMHEVQLMSATINSLASKHRIHNVLDIGSGKGYLGSFLALNYQLQVVGIDSSSTNSFGAAKQNRRLKKSWKSFKHRAEKRRVEMTKELSSQITTECQKSATHQNACIIGKKDSDENRSENEECDEMSVLKLRLPEVYDANKYVPLEQNLVDKSFVKEDCECNGNFIPVTWCVQFNTDVDEVFCAAAGSACTNHTNILVGLHTCGDLTPMMMKIFSSNPRSQILCNVGCCYNLMEEKYCRNVYWKQDDSLPEGFGFPLSRPLLDRKFTLGQNARMLACESLDRITSSQATAQSSFFYRALLQVFLKDKGIKLLPDQHVGRISAKCRNFCDYVRKALQRLNIDRLQVDANELQEYMLKYHDYLQKLDAFFHIRAMLAPVVEGLILLDRLYFLIEKNPEAASYLVQLFDPVVSPRCYAFISIKK